MEDDHEKTTHGRERMRVTDMKRILASCDDIRGYETSKGLFVLWWVFRVFLPFITRGKRFCEYISIQGSIASRFTTALISTYNFVLATHTFSVILIAIR